MFCFIFFIFSHICCNKKMSFFVSGKEILFDIMCQNSGFSQEGISSRPLLSQNCLTTDYTGAERLHGVFHFHPPRPCLLLNK